MVIDNQPLEEYPFNGAFYDYGVDDSKPLDQQVEEEILILETKCDIHSSSRSNANGIITAGFNVYFPFDKEKGISIKRGMTFKGNAYGLDINGRVLTASPSQIGGCECFVEDFDV